jgi:hypothetical protein
LRQGSGDTKEKKRHISIGFPVAVLDVKKKKSKKKSQETAQ